MADEYKELYEKKKIYTFITHELYNFVENDCEGGIAWKYLHEYMCYVNNVE